jgi:hypothetical protein
VTSVGAPTTNALDGDRPRFPGAGASLALYALLTIALTWPLVAHLSDRVPAGDNDLWQNYWNFWWWKTALVDRGTLPYSTDLIYQPGDVPRVPHAPGPIS